MTPSMDSASSLDGPSEVATGTLVGSSHLATPSSTTSMGLDMAREALEIREEEETEYESEDQDMSDEDASDGGAALHMDLPNTSISMPAPAAPPEYYEGHYGDVMDQQDEIMADIYSYAESNNSPEEQEPWDQAVPTSPDLSQALPTVLEDVVGQLQHLQNELEPAMHFSFLNSTAPFSSTNVVYPAIVASSSGGPSAFAIADTSESSASVNALVQQGGIVHTVEVVTSSVPHSFLNDTISPQANQFWSEADIDEVEDRINNSLGDFLHTWAIQSGSSTDRRARGPSLTEAHAQRYPKELPPVSRKDLNGERCDIQRCVQSLVVSSSLTLPDWIGVDLV